MHKLESPKHKPVRTFLRVAGPLLALVGVILIGVALISFFSAMGGSGMPRYFWCGFVGMPFLFIGVVMCKFGYLGSVVRYVAAETAPVAKDTANYMAEGTQEGVKTVARAITRGIQEGKAHSPQNTQKP